jgi:hypothetical protein
VACGVGADDDIGVIEVTLRPAPTEAALSKAAPAEAERFLPLIFSRTFFRLDVYLLYLVSRLRRFIYATKLAATKLTATKLTATKLTAAKLTANKLTKCTRQSMDQNSSRFSNRLIHILGWNANSKHNSLIAQDAMNMLTNMGFYLSHQDSLLMLM